MFEELDSLLENKPFSPEVGLRNIRSKYTRLTFPADTPKIVKGFKEAYKEEVFLDFGKKMRGRFVTIRELLGDKSDPLWVPDTLIESKIKEAVSHSLTLEMMIKHRSQIVEIVETKMKPEERKKFKTDDPLYPSNKWNFIRAQLTDYIAQKFFGVRKNTTEE